MISILNVLFVVVSLCLCGLFSFVVGIGASLGCSVLPRHVRNLRIKVYAASAMIGLVAAIPMSLLAYSLALRLGCPAWITAVGIPLLNALLCSFFIGRQMQKEFEMTRVPDESNANKAKACARYNQAYQDLAVLLREIGDIVGRLEVQRNQIWLGRINKLILDGFYTDALREAEAVLTYCSTQEWNINHLVARRMNKK